VSDPGILAPHGYPDWQRQFSVADVRLLNISNVAANPTSTQGPFFVGTFPGLGVRAHLDSGRATLQLDFYADSGLTQLVDGHAIFLDAGSFVRIRVPVLGPFLSVTVTDDTGAGSQYDLILNLHHSPNANQQPDPNTNALINFTGVSVGAGATRNDQAAFVRPGWAYLQHRNALATSTTRLQYLSNAGVWATIYERINVADTDAQLVLLPAAPVRIQVINTTGAAGLFSHYLNGMPGIGSL
jgi:hypothetical protein